VDRAQAGTSPGGGGGGGVAVVSRNASAIAGCSMYRITAMLKAIFLLFPIQRVRLKNIVKP